MKSNFFKITIRGFCGRLKNALRDLIKKKVDHTLNEASKFSNNTNIPPTEKNDTHNNSIKNVN